MPALPQKRSSLPPRSYSTNPGKTRCPKITNAYGLKSDWVCGLKPRTRNSNSQTLSKCELPNPLTP